MDGCVRGWMGVCIGGWVFEWVYESMSGWMGV